MAESFLHQHNNNKKLSLLVLLIAAVVTLYLSIVIAWPFLTPILTAMLLTIAIHPLHAGLRRRIPSRNAASLTATLLVMLAIVLPTAMIINRVAHETAGVYRWINDQKAVEGGWREYAEHVAAPALEWVSGKTGVPEQQLRSAALERFQNLSAALLNWAKSLAINIGATVVDTVIMLVTLFFLLRDGEYIRDRIGSLLPLEPHRYRQLVETISESITANIYGVLAVAAVQGLLGAIGYTIAGLPSVALWSVATSVFSMVPLAGAAAVWVVGCIYLLAVGLWGKALFLLIWGAGVISMADNIVRPLVLSGRVKLHTLLIFFSLLGGVRAFGIIGLFVGPIIVSVAIALIKILEEERLNWRRADAAASDDGPSV